MQITLQPVSVLTWQRLKIWTDGYHRIFSPLGSDDARHDEALASRIAALNMLDLSLDHLGLITQPPDEIAGKSTTVAEDLALIVDHIGQGE